VIVLFLAAIILFAVKSFEIVTVPAIYVIGMAALLALLAARSKTKTHGDPFSDHSERSCSVGPASRPFAFPNSFTFLGWKIVNKGETYTPPPGPGSNTSVAAPFLVIAWSP
jgi:hypothetical protein